jgi:UDP-N-acetylmuramoyl-L-alanyl-D-glutamate--2,6-diaminopimelate ligase
VRQPPEAGWAEVLDAAARHTFRGRPLTHLTDDARAVRPGSIFVARRGFAADGHDFIPEAVARGAAVLVAERPVRAAPPVCRVPDGRRALSSLADAWWGHPSRRLRVIGVTGTNGKTTTTWLLASILAAAGLSPCIVGNLGFVLRGRRRARLPWTTPPPVELHGLLAEARALGSDAAVLEVSAQSLSQARVADLAFDAAAITNLSREHGEYYADAAAYREAKLSLFRLLGRGDKPARAVLNGSLPDLARFREAAAVPTLTYGPDGEVRAVEVRSRGLLGNDLALALPAAGGSEEVLRLRLRLPGPFNVENALCAAALACALGVPAEAVAAGLGRLRHVPGRMQTVQRAPFRAVADYAHNPAGLRAVLGALRRATPGRLALVMGARGRRERGKRQLMGAVAAAFCDRVILTSDRPAGEDPAEAAEPMRRAVADVGVAVSFERDRFRALQTALVGLRPGDCAVAVGKGDEPWGEDDSAEPGPLDDVAALRRLLAGTGLGALPRVLG